MENKTPSAKTQEKNPPIKPAPKGNEGCRFGFFIGGLIGFLLLTAVVIILIKPLGIVRYGFLATAEKIGKRLEMERTLPTEQYQELRLYLESIRVYLLQTEMNSEKVTKVYPVFEAFNNALQDGQIGRGEMADIRSAIWRSNIPIYMPGSNVSQPKPEKQKKQKK